MIESPPATREIFDPKSITDETYIPSIAPDPKLDAQMHKMRFRFSDQLSQEPTTYSLPLIRAAAFEGYGCTHGFGSNCLCK